MTLRILQVPNPAVGHDWQTAVPGQWLYHVMGVTATLDTNNLAPTVAVDASGNANDGTYHAAWGVFASFVAGLVAGDPALRTGTPPFGSGAYITLPVNPLQWSADWSWGQWVAIPASGVSSQTFVQCDDGGFVNVLTITTSGGFANNVRVNGGAQPWISPSNVLPRDGSKHFVEITYIGGVMTLYVDNVVVPWGFVGLPPAVPVPMTSTALFLSGASTPNAIFTADEVMLHTVGLTAGQVNSIYTAAAVSFAAYDAAVLATAPTVYYHFDEGGAGHGRQVCLEVTDGHQTVALVPTGFVELAAGGPWLYSWQPGVQSNAETPAAGTFTVSIPDLILPAGYTIGSRTLDLGVGDQWSGILVWWDSDIMDALNPLNPYVFPPSVHLVYQQRTQPS